MSVSGRYVCISAVLYTEACYWIVLGQNSRWCALGTWKLTCGWHDPNLRQDKDTCMCMYVHVCDCICRYSDSICKYVSQCDRILISPFISMLSGLRFFLFRLRLTIEDRLPRLALPSISMHKSYLQDAGPRWRWSNQGVPVCAYRDLVRLNLTLNIGKDPLLRGIANWHTYWWKL